MGRAFEFRKARKMKRWSAMAKTFTRIGKDIVMAVKEGGPDPDNNSRLRAVMQNAKAANMPKDNIKRAIEKGSGTGDTGALEEIVLEGYGPGGVAIMVEAMSDNRNRTVSDVRHAFSKFGGNLGTDGSVSYLFNKIGIIHVAKTYSEEDILEISLEAGADDLVDEEDYFEIITSSSDLENVLKSLKENNIENTNAELTLRAETSVSVDQEMSEKVLKIMDFMDELDDVQEVHTNAEFPENFEVKE